MNLIINKTQQLFTYIINPEKSRIITHKIYANYVIIIIGLFGLISAFLNIIIDLEESIYISFGVSILAIFYFFLNRYSNNFLILLSTGYILFIAGYDFYYIFNYGSEGPMVYFGFIIAYLILLYSNKAFKHILFIIFLANITILYYLDFKIPEFVNKYETFNEQFFDHLVSIIIVFFAFVILIRNLIKIQLNEKEIVKESNQLKSTFLANTSHDLRAPTNSILSFCELISNEELSKNELKKYVKIIHSNSSQLLKLISDIFDISIIESKSLVISPKNTNINDVLEELYSNFKRDIEVSEKNIELDVRFGLPMTQSIVFIDSVRIKQILTNLIQNAIKHTEMGAIAFGYDKKMDKNELLFFVKDTGSGIPKDKMGDIFDRYVTNIDNTKTVKGTGLGLHITSSLVKHMKGEIWVESEPGIGSKFFFTIPLEDQANNRVKAKS